MDKYNKRHNKNLTGYTKKVEKLYKQAITQIADWEEDLKGFDRSKPLSLSSFPLIERKANDLLKWLSKSIATVITGGIATEWALSNTKNDATVKKMLGDDAPEKYLSRNNEALKAFRSRKEDGLNLSDRVWNYTKAYKNEIELTLDIGIRNGKSADVISRDLRQYLKNPSALFRRVKSDMVDEDGNPIWQQSKAMSEYHPGQGVYKSAYMNARRLAATETNIAYRSADSARWQQLDFVTGQHVIRSGHHDEVDICDELSGQDEDDPNGIYPKDFKFTGWHPHCRCYCVPIMQSIEDQKEGKEAEQITDTPDSFNTWVENNAERIENAKSLPYFIKDNPQYFTSEEGA